MADDGAHTENGETHTGRRASVRQIWLIVAAALVVIALIGWLIAATSQGAPETSPAGVPSSGATVSPSEGVSSPSGSVAPPATEDTPEATAPADPGAFPELAPVAPDQPAQADGIRAQLTGFESVTGEVVVPGEVQAAAVRVTVQITNTGASPLDLDLVVVSAYIGAERDPASTYQQPGGEPVAGPLDPGATATGVYLFRIPEDRRSDVTFVVDYRGGEPALTWRGQVP